MDILNGGHYSAYHTSKFKICSNGKVNMREERIIFTYTLISVYIHIYLYTYKYIEDINIYSLYINPKMRIICKYP